MKNKENNQNKIFISYKEWIQKIQENYLNQIVKDFERNKEENNKNEDKKY